MLEEFYRDHYSIVYGYLLSMCGDPHLAEDLTAETFTRAIEKIETYDPRFRASTWLCTIGKNLLLNHQKRTKRLVPIPDDLPCFHTPETLYLQKEQLRQVIHAAQKLPELSRQVVYMRWEGMPFHKIAMALGKSESWARVTYFRAKNKILSEMEDDV